jgi:hypothetical protein
MIDKAIAAGTTFDWITPLWTFVQDWRNRPSTGYSVEVSSGWSAYGLQGMLTDKGVKTWGWSIVGGTILFRARVAQATYAQHWLDKWGVPYVGGTHRPRRTERRQRKRRR